MNITARNINSKARPYLSKIMKKKHDKRVSVIFHLLEGEPSKTYEDTLVILEETLKDHGHAEYRLIRNNAIDGDMEEETEIFKLSQKAMVALERAISPAGDEISAAPNEPTFDPSKQYVVDRDKVGRPRRVLSDEEQANISRLRGQGMSINAIAKELGINNRRVMEYCKNS